MFLIKSFIKCVCVCACVHVCVRVCLCVSCADKIAFSAEICTSYPPSACYFISNHCMILKYLPEDAA